MIKVNDTFSIIESNEEPLSSDVAIIEGNDYTYIFDVGAYDKAVNEINSITKDKAVIISHFHQDHLANIDKVKYSKLYVSEHTYKYTNSGIIVKDKLEIDDGIKMTIYNIPSSHAKGCLGLLVNDYFFIGDSSGTQYKKGSHVYNVQMLKEEIDLFKKIDAKYFVHSHDMQDIKTKEEVINKLKCYYNLREKSNPYIDVKYDI